MLQLISVLQIRHYSDFNTKAAGMSDSDKGTKIVKKIVGSATSGAVAGGIAGSVAGGGGAVPGAVIGGLAAGTGAAVETIVEEVVDSVKKGEINLSDMYAITEADYWTNDDLWPQEKGGKKEERPKDPNPEGPLMYLDD